jgi:hypothetical protein
VREPLLVLNRELEITEVRLAQVDDLSWKITWKEEYPLKNRRVMLLPAWQPWQTPWEYKIPDNARGEFLLEGIGLPTSRYHLYFYVRSSWEATLSAPPENINPFEIDFCSEEERIKALEDCGSSANECFRNLLEQAVIYDSMGENSKTGTFVTQAAPYLFNLTNLELLLGSLKWIENSENVLPPFKSFFRKKMYHSQVVTNVFKKYDHNHPAVKEYLQNTIRIKNSLPADSAKLILKKVDDPIAIQTCLKTLVDKKDDDLVTVVVDLMRSGKLSKRDALDLLESLPLWALEKLEQFNPGPYVDSLIAGLIDIVVNHFILIGSYGEFEDEQRLMNWIKRAFPYIEDPEINNKYLGFLFTHHHEDRYLLLVDHFQSGGISELDAKELLSIQPFESYQVLQSYQKPECWQEWCDHLKSNYPGAFGIIQKGSWLNTPLGKSKVLRVEKVGKGEVETAAFDDNDLILNLLLEIDNEKYHMLIDFKELEISIAGYREFRKCQHCNYVHQLQNKVLQHSRVHHGVYAISVVTFPLIFEKNEITFVN